MTVLRAEGFDVDVTESGAGAPVVLLHSSGLSKRQWSRLALALAPTCRVICPDFLGYGKSGPWVKGDSFTWEADARLAAAVLGTLDAPAHLVGHSYGGLVALRAAQLCPDRVRSLALYEPVAFAVLHERNDAEGLLDLARAERGGEIGEASTGGDASWLEGFVDYWSGPGAWRALPEPARASFLAMGPKVFAEVTTLLSDRTPLAAFAAMTCPSLLLSGGKSPPAAKRVCAILADVMPNATLRVVPDAGHMGPLTHGDVVNSAIADFITRA